MCWRYMKEPATFGAPLWALRAPAVALGGAAGEVAADPVKTWNWKRESPACGLPFHSIVCVAPGFTAPRLQDCTTEPSATFTRSTRTGTGCEPVSEYARRWPRLPAKYTVRLSSFATTPLPL